MESDRSQEECVESDRNHGECVESDRSQEECVESDRNHGECVESDRNHLYYLYHALYNLGIDQVLNRKRRCTEQLKKSYSTPYCYTSIALQWSTYLEAWL